MLYIPLYTVSLLGVYWLIPRIIPTFKERYNQIYSAIKTNVVFTSECINDIHQGQLDLLDKTIGQIVNSICQSIIVAWAFCNLFLFNETESLNAFVIGFYIYDIIHLLTKHYGKTQRMYLVHHGLSIVCIVYVQYIATGYNPYININYILMEVSSTAINITNIIKFFNPASKYTITVSGINVNTYFITRVVFYPISLLFMTYDIYHSDIAAKYLYIPPVALLSLLFSVCVWWFTALIKKHEETRKKWLL